MNLRTTFLMLFLCFTALCYGQKTDTAYFDAEWKPAAKSGSMFYRVTKLVEESKKYDVTDYYASGVVQMTGTFSSLSPEIKDGVFTWYQAGKKHNETVYEQGKVKSKRFFQGAGRPASPPPSTFGFNLLETAPTYPGGMQELYKYIGSNFVYPRSLLKIKPTGKIIVNFVVEKDGSIAEAYAKQSVHPLLDAEAVRVIESMPKWTPGVQNGKPVRVAYDIPLAMN
ncbi:energy transducer TonB [Pedobacter heparinus]|uniref:energy transducer TonB n=1 Tax=Pedobacter heparinus TaxID=984 RepID=UPI00292DAFF9|nr:energy transducer TonB [Pedobacter heparinus]